MEKRIEVGRRQYPNAHPETQIAYGTAGFRTRADKLDHVLFRMGILAAVRSAKTKSVIGIMITASHNPACDNGVKLIDPMGEMLEASWEELATSLANVADEELVTELKRICATVGVPTDGLLTDARVAIGLDTRPSSVRLAAAARLGVDCCGARMIDFDLSTTPQLHYYVRCLNTEGAYGTPTQSGYLEKLATAFLNLKDLHAPSETSSSYKPELVLDGANGVGAEKAALFSQLLDPSIFKFSVVNDGEEKGDVLNEGCGADFVKTTQSASKNADVTSGRRHAAFDGDADRIVYFFFDDEEKFHLLDGDKISSLVAKYLKHLLSQAGCDSINIGVVQTAYANGSSTLYMTSQLGVPVACVPTGVKHLHRRAEAFDIGVYFEANGHGTVIFSEITAATILKKSQNPEATEGQRKAAKQLVCAMDLINQTVGDALSDMLLVETALMHFGWDCKEWNALYADFPNRLMKCQVPDRNAVKTTDAERRVTAPTGLQDRIDEIVSKFPSTSRAFVRPSGTEDVVRVYAETPHSQEETDALAKAVVDAVKEQFASS